MHVDLFCKQEGVAHQVIKARNQASNGKAANGSYRAEHGTMYGVTTY